MDITASYTNADQDWEEGTTTYWFDLTGDVEGTYGVVEGERGYAYCIDADEGAQVPETAVGAAIKQAMIVTDQIRKEASGL